MPRKISKNTGQEQYAFAKTDRAFKELLDHDDPAVQTLVAARLGHKSTLEETRATRFRDISRLTSRMPVPLNYSGAHTHRFSGAWSLNMQNLPNDSKLRLSLRAPKGCVVVAVDASQIEARLNASLAGETELIEGFRQGRDVYCEFASLIYRKPINKRDHPNERFVGKTGILSLGYGSSAPVFQNMVRNKGGVVLTDNEAWGIVSLYRQTYSKIAAHWRYADKTILPAITNQKRTMWGPLQVGNYEMMLPNGNRLYYPSLKFEYDEEFGKFQWRYLRATIPHHIYGAKVVENACQSLAFVHIAAVAIRVASMTDRLLLPVHQMHDELIYVVPEKIAEQVRDLVVAEMSKPPEWLPDCPLAAEGKIGESYGEV